MTSTLTSPEKLAGRYLLFFCGLPCLTNFAMDLQEIQERYKNLDKRLKEAKELKKEIHRMELELQQSKCTENSNIRLKQV